MARGDSRRWERAKVVLYHGHDLHCRRMGLVLKCIMISVRFFFLVCFFFFARGEDLARSFENQKI